MQLPEIEYSESRQEFFAFLDSVNAVIKTFIFRAPQDSGDIESLSKAATLSGMKLISDQNMAHFEMVKEKWPEHYSPDHFRISIEEEKLTGWKITFQEFLGGGFDFELKKLNLFEYHPASKSISHSGDQEDKAFAYALLNPPYSLSISRSGEFASLEYEASETNSLTGIIEGYLRIMLQIDELDSPDDLIVYRWSGDWSNFFDAGNEWWGAFFWTVYNPKAQEIIVIAASATD